MKFVHLEGGVAGRPSARPAPSRSLGAPRLLTPQEEAVPTAADQVAWASSFGANAEPPGWWSGPPSAGQSWGMVGPPNRLHHTHLGGGSQCWVATAPVTQEGQRSAVQYDCRQSPPRLSSIGHFGHYGPWLFIY